MSYGTSPFPMSSQGSAPSLQGSPEAIPAKRWIWNGESIPISPKIPSLIRKIPIIKEAKKSLYFLQMNWEKEKENLSSAFFKELVYDIIVRRGTIFPFSILLTFSIDMNSILISSNCWSSHLLQVRSQLCEFELIYKPFMFYTDIA